VKTRSIPSSQLEREGRRLDCKPYVSGAFEARILLESLDVRKDALCDVTLNGKMGIFNGPRFARSYVDDLENGVPFLGSTDILNTDLRNLPLLSKKQVAENPGFVVQPEWTLITCSGTIGRMAYARSDMAGMAGSQHFMRVVPDAKKIPPGYLFAYLSSKFGVPLVTGGTYGAIIQHIEPEHIADLPVPRLGSRVEAKVHKLIDEAANELTRYSRLCSEATSAVLSGVGISDVTPGNWLNDTKALGWAEGALTTETFRAMNFDPRAQELWRIFARSNASPLGSVCLSEFFKGKNIFKRIDADPQFGVMLLGQRNAFHFRPDGRWISRKSVEKQGLAVPALSTLIASHGTLGEHELYCRALIVTRSMHDLVFSGDFFRCVPDGKKIPAGYLFAFLRSNAAFRILRSISIGGKQQEQHPSLMWRLPVPRLHPQCEHEIHSLIEQAVSSYDIAVRADLLARKIVEDAIETGVC
jgi:hypothetical protein